MKILILIHSLRRGGAERVALSQASGLIKKGHIINIISWLDNDEFVNEYPEVQRSYIIKQEDYNWIWSLKPSSKILAEMIKDLQPDIIQIHTPTMHWLLGLTNLSIPSVHILHGYGGIEKSSSLKNLLFKYVSRYFTKKLNNLFITVSPSMNLLASQYYSNSEKEYVTIPNGIDLKKFPYNRCQDSNLKNFNPQILMIGTLTSNKGQMHGIAAFQLLKNAFPDAKLLIIGDGEDKLKILQKIEELNLVSRIKLLGMQSSIERFLTPNSILWQFSKTEAMPMTVLESMASGVPVIGFDVRGINDVVINGETGILIPYGDTEEAAFKTKTLLNNYSLRQKFSINGRQRVLEKFTNDKMINSYETLMKKMLR